MLTQSFRRHTLKCKQLVSVTLLITLLFTAYSCDKSEDIDNNLLVSTTNLAEYSLSQISDVIEESADFRLEDLSPMMSIGGVKFDLFLQMVANQVICFDKIVYKSVDGNCSALVVYPRDTIPQTIVLGMHHTISRADEAPTRSLFSGEILLAYLNFCVVIPDYIGFGESEDKTHPYLHIESTGKDAINAVIACKEYFSEVKHIELGSSIYIAGYSEGGANALAVQKVMERDKRGGISPKKVYCGGAPSDLVATFDEVMTNDNNDYPYGVAMVPIGLDAGGEMNMDFSKIFSGKLATNYKEWFLSKKYYTYQINDLIGSNSVVDYMNPDFWTSGQNSEIKRLKQALKENSLVSGWTPVAPILMVHGTNDMTVPYINAENAYESFIAKGCDITLISAEHCDHATAFFYYLINVFYELLLEFSAPPVIK